ncbi:type II secretion system protein [Candidatus Uabimicrobium sp. HlEnr_7]|uniref:type II secretion system protein n=1 Tax=Candidatus Uabimicrobium helgolandensis TaxID=3095367 RepID=UPI0035590CAD
MNKKSILVVVMVVLTIIVVFRTIESSIMKAKQELWCKMNLEQMAKGLNMYLLDFGKEKFYPQKNGQGFLLALYEEKLVDYSIYTCHSTQDYKQTEKLKSAPDKGDGDGPISYAGRKNSQQNSYPGIFKPYEDTTTTPIASDDFGTPYNHENGKAMNILFLDMHVDFKRKSDPDFPDIDVLAN